MMQAVNRPLIRSDLPLARSLSEPPPACLATLSLRASQNLHNLGVSNGCQKFRFRGLENHFFHSTPLETFKWNSPEIYRNPLYLQAHCGYSPVQNHETESFRMYEGQSIMCTHQSVSISPCSMLSVRCPNPSLHASPCRDHIDNDHCRFKAG